MESRAVSRSDASCAFLFERQADHLPAGNLDRGHGYSSEGYILRRTWDYFVTHLLEKKPPREYRIGG